MKLLLALFIAGGTAAFAGPIDFYWLSFDGLQNGEQVLSFYDGGFGGQGSGPGQAYGPGPAGGVSFTDGLAADSTGFIFGPYSPSARLTAPSVTMNLDDPWGGDVISFYFIGTGVVSFYSGLDGSGTLVASYPLSFPTLFVFGETPGTFQSVVFDSDSGLQLDSITFGLQVIPEPSGLTLLSFGDRVRCWNAPPALSASALSCPQ